MGSPMLSAVSSAAGAKAPPVERWARSSARTGKHRGRLISLFLRERRDRRAVGGCAVAADASPELLGLYEDLQKAGPEAVHAALLALDADTQRTREATMRCGIHRPRRRDALRPLSSGSPRWPSMGLGVNSRGAMNMGVDRARLVA